MENKQVTGTDPGRRDFLQKAGKFVVAAPPVMGALLTASVSNSALAGSPKGKRKRKLKRKLKKRVKKVF